mgnify:CR=1 FL=1
MAEEKFIDDDFDLEEMVEYGMVDTRCEMCKHFLGKSVEALSYESCSAYKQIPEAIWNEDVYHESVRSDQIGEFIYKKD